MYEIAYPQFDPVLIEIGPLAIRWYSLAYIAGIIGGWRLGLRMVSNARLWEGYPYPAAATKRKHAKPAAPMTRDHIDDFLVWATIGVILGGRLGFVLFYNLGEYLSDPISVLYVWQGGMSFHGGLAGVVIAIILFARSRGINMFSLGDVIATVAPLGYFFGRIANFINGELWGRAADVPWAMVFPRDELQIARHPSQLYQAGLDGALLFAIMLVAVFRFGTLKLPGLTLGIFLTGYGCARFFTENFREPDEQLGYLIGSWLTMGMVLSLPMIVAGIWFIWRANTEPHLGHQTVSKDAK
ncbi:MAG: prolipoprotein diacylglyceryl transferase [Candidatus Phaeomarinobacter sp.]